MDLPDGPQDFSTDVSLVTGRLRCLGVDEGQGQEESLGGGAVVKRDDVLAMANTAGLGKMLKYYHIV